VNDPEANGRAFICYAREDGDFALSLAAELRNCGVPVWIDRWNIEPGANWDAAIDHAIRACTSFVIVLSPDAVASAEVRGELRRALNETKFIVPLLHRVCEIPRQLETVQYADFTGLASPSGGALKDLEHALRQHVLRAPEASTGTKRSHAVQKKSPGSGAMMRHRSVAPSRETRNRSAVIEDMRSEAAARLAQTVQPGRQLTILKERQPYQVIGSWHNAVKMAPVVRSSPPTAIDIIEAFDDEAVGGKLLILGNPGSGKTTALLQLARDLAIRAGTDAGEPIPVVLNLSSWRGKGLDTLAGWMIDELKLKYGVRREYGRQWLNDRSLAPMLDGLDELPPERQEACVLAINHFQQQHGTQHLVVCCRVAEYENFSVKLQLFGAVRLVPLDSLQIKNYLERAGTPDLWSTISGDPESLELASSPLFLQMMTFAHQEMSMLEWQRLGSARDRRSYLFDVYIFHLLSATANNDRYTNDRIRTWLTWLASSLKRFGQEEFLLERMQPSWLASRRQLWSYRVVVFLTVLMCLLVADRLTDVVGSLLPQSSTRVKPGTATWVFGFVDVLRIVQTLLLASIAGVVIAVRPIAPIETLRWSGTNAWQGVTRWLRRAVPPACNYGFLVGLVGGALAGIVGIFRPMRLFGGQTIGAISINNPRAGFVLGIFAIAVWLVAVGTMRWPSRWIEGGAPSRLSTREANAIIAGLVGAAAATISAGYYGAFFGIAVAIVPGASRTFGRASSRRFVQGFVSILIGWFGVSYVLMRGSSYSSFGDVLLTWATSGTGVAMTAALLLAFATRVGLKTSVVVSPFRRFGRLKPAAEGFETGRRESGPSVVEEAAPDEDVPFGRMWAMTIGIGAALALLLGGVSALLVLAGLRHVIQSAVLVALAMTGKSTVVQSNASLIAVYAAAFASFFAAVVGSVIGLLNGLTGPDVAKRTRPNQGIRQSAFNTLVFGAVAACAVGLPFGLMNLGGAAVALASTPVTFADAIQIVVINALMVGLIGALVPGAACVQHFALRFVLWCGGHVPWRYQRFLEYAAKRMLLQRIGGRYRFLHVLLCDHFAAMLNPKKAAPPATIPNDLGPAAPSSILQ